MSVFVVEGGHRLSGSITPAGNKNAALPALCAALLCTDGAVTLENVPRITDVETLLDLISSIGGSISRSGSTVTIDASSVSPASLDAEAAKRIRASILLAGPLLARFGTVELPPPGGDVIGRRRLDTHFMAFERMGATVEVNGTVKVDAPAGMKAATIFLDEPSVTGTENAIMACVLTPGVTVLRNAASEPHVQDLCNLLNGMGAQIDGVGTGTLRITGVDSLHGATYRLKPDHIEIGSFIGLASMTRSDLAIADVAFDDLDSTLLGFTRLGIAMERRGDALFVRGSIPPVIQKDHFGHIPKIDDGPWPAFPADLTSIALATATMCDGIVLIHEKMFESRMFFTDKLVAMGALVHLNDPHRAIVVGPAKLRGSRLESPDIRAGMAMLLAALAADGESRIYNAGQIDRGYERIVERLGTLGARIHRVSSQ